MASDARIYGLDGCPGGWVVASSSPDLTDVTWARVADADLRAFFESLAKSAGAMAIDVPIGLAEREARVCDQMARQRLGFPRLTSVFSAPCRATLSATCYHQACAINRNRRGCAISLQTWHIVNKIAAVDALLDELPGLATRLRESHPEVTFAELSAQPRGLSAPKKSAEGERLRQALLAHAGLALDVDAIRHQLVGRRVGRDDIVDAAACLLTAVRLTSGQARLFPPGPPPRDTCGRAMQIVA